MPADSSNDYWSELRSGNADALLALYKEHYVGLMNYGLRLTADPELTKDCITQMMLNLHRQHRRLPPVTNIRSYLLTSLRNEILSVLRAGNRKHQLNTAVSNENGSERSYEDHLVAIQTDEEQRLRIQKAMEVLTGREKELLRLRFFEDKAYDEIASDCGVTKRTAYNIINTALKKLKEKLVHPSGAPLFYLSLAELLNNIFL